MIIFTASIEHAGALCRPTGADSSFGFDEMLEYCRFQLAARRLGRAEAPINE